MDSKDKTLYSYFLYWGKNSRSRNGGFVYDNNDMTWSSVYGSNGIYSNTDENFELTSEYYGPDFNFNDNDW